MSELEKRVWGRRQVREGGGRKKPKPKLQKYLTINKIEILQPNSLSVAGCSGSLARDGNRDWRTWMGARPQEVHGQVRMGVLFQFWQLPRLHRFFTEYSLPLGAHSSILQGHFLALFGTKSLFNVRLFWNVWYFIKYLKSTKGRQKIIPHCNIYILRAWLPGSGLNHGAWEWKRQRGNIRDRRVINRKKKPTCRLAGWRTSFGPHSFHIQYICSSLLSSPWYLVLSNMKHQVYSGSCQEVFLSLPLRCRASCARDNLRVRVLVFSP